MTVERGGGGSGDGGDGVGGRLTVHLWKCLIITDI